MNDETAYCNIVVFTMPDGSKETWPVSVDVLSPHDSLVRCAVRIEAYDYSGKARVLKSRYGETS